MDVPKYIHYDFVPDVHVDIIKRVLNLDRELRFVPFCHLAWDKTISAKTINKKIKPFKGVTPIMCMIELDMVGA